VSRTRTHDIIIFNFFKQTNAVAEHENNGNSEFNYKDWACKIGGPEPWEDNASPLTSRINTGVTFFRSTVGGTAMAVSWIESLRVRQFSFHD
jgi:hypothetical protein